MVVDPGPRTLMDILAEAMAHVDEHPTHGPHCTCHDARLRELRAQVRPLIVALPDEFRYDPANPTIGQRKMAVIQYILNRVGEMGIRY